jgi:hypothetical protein
MMVGIDYILAPRLRLGCLPVALTTSDLLKVLGGIKSELFWLKPGRPNA